jgi:hypothetical protein
VIIAACRGRRDDVNSLRRFAVVLVLLFYGCSDLLVDDYHYGTLEVQAIRRNGDPVADVQLILHRGGQHLAYGTTDEEGRFRFELVPFGVLGIVATLPEDYLSQGFQPLVVRESIDFQEGSVETVTLPPLLRKGPGAVEVQTVSSAGGVMPGIRIELYAPNGTVAAGVTDAAGRARFESVPFGNYGLLAHLPVGFVGKNGSPFALVDGVLVDAGSRENVLVTLQRCQGTIAARAIENGAPVQGAILAVYRFNGEVARRATDATGTASFVGLPCDNYGVTIVELTGYTAPPGRGGSFFDGVKLERDNDRREVTFTLQRCIGRVRVRVLDDTGRPVAGTSVDLYRASGVLGNLLTSTDGVADFTTAPCGDLGVSIRAPAGFRATPGRGGTFLDGVSISNGTFRDLVFTVTRA